MLRKVSTLSDVRWKKLRIMAGRGLVNRPVRVEETDASIDLYFAHVRIRSIPFTVLKPGQAML